MLVETSAPKRATNPPHNWVEQKEKKREKREKRRKNQEKTSTLRRGL